MDILVYLSIGILLLVSLVWILSKRYRARRAADRLADAIWDSDAAEQWRKEFDRRKD